MTDTPTPMPPPDGLREARPSWQTERIISHAEAKEIAGRLINSHFHKEPHARIGIPARPDYDDDLLICTYIAQQEARASALAPEVAVVFDPFPFGSQERVSTPVERAQKIDRELTDVLSDPDRWTQTHLLRASNVIRDLLTALTAQSAKPPAEVVALADITHEVFTDGGVFSLEECPFFYCDMGNDGECKKTGKCWHA